MALRPAEAGAAGDEAVCAIMYRCRVENFSQDAALDRAQPRLRRFEEARRSGLLGDEAIAVMAEGRVFRLRVLAPRIRQPFEMRRRDLEPAGQIARGCETGNVEADKTRRRRETGRFEDEGDRCRALRRKDRIERLGVQQEKDEPCRRRRDRDRREQIADQVTQFGPAVAADQLFRPAQAMPAWSRRQPEAPLPGYRRCGLGYPSEIIG